MSWRLSIDSRHFPSIVKKMNNNSIILRRFVGASFQIKMEDINRLKVVLAEKKRTNKWLAEQLGKDPATISKWCNNKTQPSLEVLRQIASLLNVDVKDLLLSSK